MLYFEAFLLVTERSMIEILPYKDSHISSDKGIIKPQAFRNTGILAGQEKGKGNLVIGPNLWFKPNINMQTMSEQTTTCAYHSKHPRIIDQHCQLTCIEAALRQTS